MKEKKAKAKVEGEGRKVSHSQIKDELAWRGAARKAGRRPTFSAGMTANLEKTHQWCVVLSRIGALSEELRILRQTKGITAGEKKAISAMLDKLDRFDEYGLHGCTKEGGAK